MDLTRFVPFLQAYPTWVKVLVAGWVLVTAALVVVLLFTKLPAQSDTPTQFGGAETHEDATPDRPVEPSTHTPQPKTTIEAPSEKPKSPTSQPSTQTMINSPGGIQAGRDVIISADRRLIQTMVLRVFVETETPDAEPGDVQTDVGLGSVVALFTRDKTRIRFESDFRVTDQQVSRNRRRVGFVYSPETPTDILGKDVNFLATIDVLAVNRAEIFQSEKFDTSNDKTRFSCSVFVNGVNVATVDAGVQPPGALQKGQVNLDVAAAFANALHVYAAAVSRQ